MTTAPRRGTLCQSSDEQTRQLWVAKPVQAHAAFSVVCGKPGAKAKTNKSAAKRFKITASGKVRTRNHLTLATARTRAHPGRDKA